MSLLLFGLDAEKVHYCYHIFVAIGRQIVNGASLGFCHKVVEACIRTKFGNSAFFCHLGCTFHLAIPHDIVDAHFVAEEYFLARIAVDNQNKAFAMLSGEI